MDKNFTVSSDTVTEGIRVQVYPEYVPEQSDPAIQHYFFKYRVKISNESDTGIHLLSRQWLIIDADGTEDKIEGEGVVGFTPYVEPGTSFEYESFCPLATPWGTMEGKYRAKTEDGKIILAEIGRFYLCDIAFA